MWVRGLSINGHLMRSFSRVRMRYELQQLQYLSTSTLRNHPNNGYFQEDTASYRPPTQISRNIPSGPIYVLPTTGQGDEHTRAKGSTSPFDRITYLIAGAMMGIFLMTATNQFLSSRATSTHGKVLSRSTGHVQGSAGDIVEPEQGDNSGQDPESEYAEDDGTETHRVRRNPGQSLQSAEILALEKDIVLQKLWNLRETVDKDNNNAYTQSLLESANASQLRIHMTLMNLVTGPYSTGAFLDNALLESRPLCLKDETPVPSESVSLIRVLDSEGKNKLIMLGVDLDWHESNSELSSRFPSGSYGIDQWLMNLANEFERKGQNAPDLTIFLYSNRVIVDVNHATGNSWVTRYRQSDFPPGFPLAQMRQVKKATDPRSNVVNLSKAETSGRGKDAS